MPNQPFTNNQLASIFRYAHQLIHSGGIQALITLEETKNSYTWREHGTAR